MKRLISGGAILTSLAATACGDPEFTPRTTAPPGAVADYFEDRSNDARSIRLTDGIAFALECADAKGRPCSFDGTTVDDPSVAEVYRAFGDIDQKLVRGPTPPRSSYQTRTLFVVTGKRVGRTTITVRHWLWRRPDRHRDRRPEELTGRSTSPGVRYFSASAVAVAVASSPLR